MFEQLSAAKKNQANTFIKREISVDPLESTPKVAPFVNYIPVKVPKNSNGGTTRGFFYNGRQEIPIIRRNYTYAACVSKSPGSKTYIKLPRLPTQQDPISGSVDTVSVNNSSDTEYLIALPDILPPLHTARSFSQSSTSESSVQVTGVKSLSPSFEPSVRATPTETVLSNDQCSDVAETLPVPNHPNHPQSPPFMYPTLPTPRGKTSAREDNKIGKKWINKGERYNEFGQLVGKSGKLLRDTKRASQNRSAQKAFRVRREKYIKGLEVKSQMYDKLVEENLRLQIVIEDLKRGKGPI